MKRDMELVRKILLEIENHESGYAPMNIAIAGYTEEQIRYHAFIMMEAGLIEGIKRTDLSSPSPQAIPRSLTWQCHEFIDTARNDTLWSKAMNIVQDKGGSISISVLSQLLASLMKNQIGLS
jgi:Hypothetical protein (DUF2513)